MSYVLCVMCYVALCVEAEYKVATNLYKTRLIHIQINLMNGVEWGWLYRRKSLIHLIITLILSAVCCV